ncbi:MAG: type II toxin-antitoxin system RelE/ParE family toxin [Micropepsaceae bacterium]
MSYRVERALGTDRDLAAIFEFLIESYQAFGEDEKSAIDRAARRVRAIESEMLAIGKAPQQGTLRPDLMQGLRSVTRRRAVFYFLTDEKLKRVRILAIFFAGQDHQRRMLTRLLGGT